MRSTSVDISSKAHTCVASGLFTWYYRQKFPCLCPFIPRRLWRGPCRAGYAGFGRWGIKSYQIAIKSFQSPITAAIALASVVGVNTAPLESPHAQGTAVTSYSVATDPVTSASAAGSAVTSASAAVSKIFPSIFPISHMHKGYSGGFCFYRGQ
ncbi:hypothetical protein B0H14DRAFT_2563007 [Mycena olivaceomarginata]|nr:hypothetical protein B0H14DRAFT_2563007 [Mycena olivaceomarginata]